VFCSCSVVLSVHHRRSGASRGCVNDVSKWQLACCSVAGPVLTLLRDTVTSLKHHDHVTWLGYSRNQSGHFPCTAVFFVCHKNRQNRAFERLSKLRVCFVPNKHLGKP
jgi:hypothetical protein